MEAIMVDDNRVSIEDLLKKIGFMSIQLDVAAETIKTLQDEIIRLRADEVVISDTKTEPEKTPTKK
jgi:hypothetical protein